MRYSDIREVISDVVKNDIRACRRLPIATCMEFSLESYFDEPVDDETFNAFCEFADGCSNYCNGNYYALTDAICKLVFEDKEITLDDIFNPKEETFDLAINKYDERLEELTLYY